MKFEDVHPKSARGKIAMAGAIIFGAGFGLLLMGLLLGALLIAGVL